MSLDRYKYFRIEARELVDGMTQLLLEIERSGPAEGRVSTLLRLAHTLKGAARVVGLGAIAEDAHAIEDLLEPFRGGSVPLTRDVIEHVLFRLDAVSAGVAGVSAPDGRADSRPAAAVEEAFETVRIELDALDALQEGLVESGIQLDGLRRHVGTLDRLRSQLDSLGELATHPAVQDLEASLGALRQALDDGLDRTATALEDSRAKANAMRLVPASRVFSQLERAVRDAAESLGKRVAFEALGGSARLEGHVLLPMRDALLHMVRNAVDHGIEPEAERLATGKPATGKVQVSLVRKGNRLVFTCTDDGRGIDVEAVRQAAVQHGIIDAADALAPDDLVQLILRAGVSTTSAVTTFSGRGIGLDVVRETVSKLDGELSIQSSPGGGTTLSISVPLSLSSIPTLVVQAGEAVAAIPLSAVRQALRVQEAEISRTAAGATVLHDGIELPFRPLAELMKQASAHTPRSYTLIVIEAQATRAAFGVDRILGVSEVVLRPLPAAAGTIPLVAGASFDAEGHPQPILDPRSLVEAARMEPSLPKPAPRKSNVLVIDDSLTTRMLEQSILESAGYAVELAANAEEGLAMAQAKAYDLFLVDIEMPGMDGFAFLGRIRADAKLSQVPAVMVTSRNAPEDRRRGMEAGAQAYLVKSEFHQGLFLKTISTLLSEAHG